MIMIERVTNSRADPHPPLTLQSQAILEGGGRPTTAELSEKTVRCRLILSISLGVAGRAPSPLPGVEDHHCSGATRQLAGAARRRRRALTGRQHPRPALAASWGVLGADG